MTEPLSWAIILALGVATCQDAIMSILWYVSNKSNETWLYNHAARLMRLAGGFTLIGISVWRLMC